MFFLFSDPCSSREGSAGGSRRSPGRGALASELQQRGGGGASRVPAVIPSRGPAGPCKEGRPTPGSGLLGFAGTRGRKQRGRAELPQAGSPAAAGRAGAAAIRSGEAAPLPPWEVRSGGGRGGDARRGLPGPVRPAPPKLWVSPRPPAPAGGAARPAGARLGPPEPGSAGCSRARPPRRGSSRARGAAGGGGRSRAAPPGRAPEGCRRRREAGGQGPRCRCPPAAPRQGRELPSAAAAASRAARQPAVRRVAVW